MRYFALEQEARALVLYSWLSDRNERGQELGRIAIGQGPNAFPWFESSGKEGEAFCRKFHDLLLNVGIVQGDVVICPIWMNSHGIVGPIKSNSQWLGVYGPRGSDKHLIAHDWGF